MNAIAITANDPLGMPGGVFPLKGTRSTPSFVNLFSGFEKPGTSAVKTGGPMTKATAASNQIAEAMIRSMLGSPVSAPVEIVNARPGMPAAASGTAVQPEAVAQVLPGSTSIETTTPEASAGGDSLLRSMLGMQTSAPAAQDPADAAPAETTTDEVPLGQSMPGLESSATAEAEAAVEPETVETLPQMENASAADGPAAARGSMRKIQNAPRAQSRAVLANGQANVAAMATATAPVPTPGLKSEAVPVQSPNATRTLAVAGTRSTGIAAAPARQQTDDTDTVEHLAEPGTSSDAPGPLAFSLNLAPILPAQIAATTETAAAPATPPVADSHLIDSQFQSVETQAPASEDETTRTAAPEKSGNGNAAGHDDRSSERDAPENLKNDAPQATPALAGTFDTRGAWTMNTAAVAVENRTDTPAAPAAQPASPGPQVAEANSTVAMKPAAAQEITVRISQPDSPVVDLHVTERGGEIHVAVRTSDPELQTALRQDLGTLTNSLERAGYHAETLVPRASGTSQANLRDEREQQGFSGRGGSQGESGSGKQKGQREQRSASWLEELEQSK